MHEVIEVGGAFQIAAVDVHGVAELVSPGSCVDAKRVEIHIRHVHQTIDHASKLCKNTVKLVRIHSNLRGFCCCCFSGNCTVVVDDCDDGLVKSSDLCTGDVTLDQRHSKRLVFLNFLQTTKQKFTVRLVSNKNTAKA